MNEIGKIKLQINELNLLKSHTQDTGILTMLNKNINSLQERLEQLESTNEKNLLISLKQKLTIVKNKLDKAILNNNLKEYKELEKEKKELLKLIREYNGEVKYLTTKQIKSIISAIKLNSDSSVKEELMVRIGFEYGLRSSELVDLKKSDINLATNEILCRRKKNSIQAKFKLTPTIINLLIDHMKSLDKNNDFLFCNAKGERLTTQGLNYIFKKYCSIALIPKELRHYHILKHSRGVFLAEKGFNLQEIKYLLGHKELKSTMVYTSFTKAQKDNINYKLDNLRDI